MQARREPTAWAVIQTTGTVGAIINGAGEPDTSGRLCWWRSRGWLTSGYSQLRLPGRVLVVVVFVIGGFSIEEDMLVGVHEISDNLRNAFFTAIERDEVGRR